MEYSDSRARMKDTWVIEILTRVHGYSFPNALRTWYTSKTRERLFDKSDPMLWVSPARMVEELLREVNNDPYWFSFSFE